MRSVLHVGCGRHPLPDWLGDCHETRLDIDPDVQPDIVASLTDMGEIGPFDVVYTTHTLEHVYPHEVPVALAEIRRVLKPGGFAIIIVPDLEGVQATEEVVYDSLAGPVSGLDMIYGMGRLIQGNRHMAHHCGFVRETLKRVIDAAGFERSEVTRTNFNLFAAAVA
jgi:predicted SAM-dependent methyltransferase